jgi:hypothetical protein
VEEKISKEDYDEFVSDTNEEINTILSRIEQLKRAFETNHDELAIMELKQHLDKFIEFHELTPNTYIA